MIIRMELTADEFASLLESLSERVADKVVTRLKPYFEQELQAMSQMDDEIAALQADVTAEGTIIDSASTMISGFSAQITAAVNAALAAGATSVQLQSLTDLKTAVDAKTAELSAAVAANTPAAPPAPAPAPSSGSTTPTVTP